MFNRFLAGPLCDAAGDGGGGGGAVTVDQILEKVKEAVGPLIDAKFTELTNSYDKKLKTHAKGLLTPLLDDVKKNLGKGGGGGGGKTPKSKKLVRELLAAGKSIDEIKALGLKIPKKLRDQQTTQKTNNDGTQQTQNQPKFKDVLGKKKLKRLEAEVEQMKADKAAAEKKADDATVDGEVRAALGEFSWVNPKAQKAVYQEIRAQVTKDVETGTLLIDEAKLEDWVKAKVPDEFDWALKPENKSGAGPTKGTAKSKGMDMDSWAGMSATDRAAEGKKLAELVGTTVGVN